MSAWIHPPIDKGALAALNHARLTLGTKNHIRPTHNFTQREQRSKKQKKKNDCKGPSPYPQISGLTSLPMLLRPFLPVGPVCLHNCTSTLVVVFVLPSNRLQQCNLNHLNKVKGALSNHGAQTSGEEKKRTTYIRGIPKVGSSRAEWISLSQHLRLEQTSCTFAVC